MTYEQRQEAFPRDCRVRLRSTGAPARVVGWSKMYDAVYVVFDGSRSRSLVGLSRFERCVDAPAPAVSIEEHR